MPTILVPLIGGRISFEVQQVGPVMEVWASMGPLAGVLIGGGITWWIQRAAADRSDRAAAARFLTERRQAAYTEYLRASFRQEIMVARFVDVDHPLDAVQAEVLDGETALMAMKLIAPQDTIVAAMRLQNAVLLSKSGGGDPGRQAVAQEELSAARKEFLACARRDVGDLPSVTGPAPQHPNTLTGEHVA